MIDIENEVFTMIATPLREKYSNIFVTSEEVLKPTEFPCASIVETDNYISSENIDSFVGEKYSIIVYTVNVYSNKTNAKKNESKDIMKVIDNVLVGKGFNRIEKTPVILEDSTIYRIVARYRGKTDGKYIYSF